MPRVPGAKLEDWAAIVILAASAVLLWLGLARAQDPDLDLPVLPPPYTGPEEPAPHQELPDAAPALVPPAPEPVPPVTFYGVDVLAEGESVVFVLDASGSMLWPVDDYLDHNGQLVTEGTRFSQARSELVKAIRKLPQTSSFAVLAYECQSHPWGDGGLVAATPEAKADAEAWVLAYPILYGGLTGTVPATMRALEVGPDVVVLLTDGAPNCWPGGRQGTALEQAGYIDAANRRRTPIHVFGVGLLGDSRAFCQRVARDSGGLFIEVQP